VTTFKMPEEFQSILDKQLMGPTTKNFIKSDFPVQPFKPKVQIAFRRLPERCPQEIEVESGYFPLTFDIAQPLASKGIDSNLLMPRHCDPNNMPTIEKNKDPVFLNLPLKIFDSYEYDYQTPEERILLGLEPGPQDGKPVPGKVLLPTDDVLGHEDPKSQKLIYKWINVDVPDYDKETELYLAHKTDKNGLVWDEEGRPILNGG
ncbi:DYH1 protein, partial [Eurystomus gularis]|nr:DYH1 protein [Eurystomus gularis]